MDLKYAGPKPLISAHGITFDLNKEDKFAYLSIVAELIQALDHNYQADERYTYLAKAEPLKADIIFDLIKSKDPALLSQIEERRLIAENDISDELVRAHENKTLCEEECNVLICNIELLRTYQINRAINKTLYYAGINVIAEEIKKGHIDYINTPMFPKFLHVLHSVQGALSKLHPPIDSNIDIREHEGHLQVRLEILSKH
ncbi:MULTISPECIES: hypothetical protein [unclassified Sulfuricurvum]|uniref:hypothetical protein n=1 Tax=unclassified Sulfuricurvum TaxID=2632390 RepID=UPI0002997023|nr:MULTISPECIES: hypothetical protein [unclassified Sulfuricurvum]OHD83520.1 MAG: hypothetical protein A2Y52_01010 [Sulfuricurvum sp. RIFCSPLOWO2_02_43_6]OHD86609.1 MAG: hypothetical protein A3I60_07155 [Sulfuricurvum sp. RIFCSPLOWO2_02_FULL_43_45]OHD88045.1 MAG: hypothetical protein A3J39_05835 [Sulfuricurvum sp. RIFCSPHIGHO2_12_FULL_44_8]AFV97764.1 hypothetical protein B649_07260 [Candidatus Sulfuricurvum sp. RIFRC-1]OHD90569.1 MAG: hypothetical protein A3G19_07240 [Sulfuricurvum sp. RIFCSPL